jgi:hypothetical protein
MAKFRHLSIGTRPGIDQLLEQAVIEPKIVGNGVSRTAWYEKTFINFMLHLSMRLIYIPAS